MDKYIATIPEISVRLKRAVAMAQGSSLQLLDQQTLTQETLVNLMILWVSELSDARGAKGIEEAFGGMMEILTELVREDMKKHEAEGKTGAGGAPEENIPDGFSRPGNPESAKGSGPDKKSRRRKV